MKKSIMVIWFGFSVETNAFCSPPLLYRGIIQTFDGVFFRARKKITSIHIKFTDMFYIFNAWYVYVRSRLIHPIPETMLNTGYSLYLLWALCIRVVSFDVRFQAKIKVKKERENMCHFLHRSMWDLSQHEECSNKSNLLWPSKRISFCGATFVRMDCVVCTYV